MAPFCCLGLLQLQPLAGCRAGAMHSPRTGAVRLRGAVCKAGLVTERQLLLTAEAGREHREPAGLVGLGTV